VAGGAADIFYKCWNTSSSVWTTNEVLFTTSAFDSAYPSLAIDLNNYVHVVWHDPTDYDSAGTDTDIFYRYLGVIPEIPEFADIDFNLTEYVIVSSLIIGACFFMFVVTKIRKKNLK